MQLYQLDFYNIGKMKEEAHPKIKGSYAKKGNGPRGLASSKTSIADAGNSIKGKFSVAEETKTAWNTDKEQRDIDELLKVNPDWAQTLAEIREYADGKAAQHIHIKYDGIGLIPLNGLMKKETA